MDRNSSARSSAESAKKSLSARRAWIEMILAVYAIHKPVSLSARRAWIEMIHQLTNFSGFLVALRKESVDRNRRHEDGSLRLDTVALRKEGVDRNPGAAAGEYRGRSRSPQGGRG